MDILHNLVYPQSPNHIVLLQYLFFLTLLLLLPYLSVLIGTTLMSLMHFKKGQKLNDKKSFVFAKDLIDLFTRNKVMAIGLGIVPMLSLTFVLSQLLFSSKLNTTPDLLFALILFVAALVYIYIYKYSFTLKNIFTVVNVKDITNQNLANEFEALKKSNSKLLSKSGLIGFVLLLIAAYLLIAVLSFIVTKANENSFYSLILSPSAILYFLLYLAFSISITSAAIIYKYFKNNWQDYNPEYLSYVKNFTLKTGLIFTTVQPLLFVLYILASPNVSLSFGTFITGAIVLSFMLLISILFYLMYKDSKMHLGGSTVFVFLILFAALIYKDQLAFDTKNAVSVNEQEKEYLAFASKVKEEAGVKEVVVISGKSIYDNKCSACHRFDQKLVGPAYSNVLPKYEGKRDQLIDFILNPRKINPELPTMPNQGLKPNEAEAIADYIVKMYHDSKK